MRILFLVRSLDYGGAERQLSLLAPGLTRRGHDIGVAVFYAGGLLARPLEDAGVRVVDLEKRGRWSMGLFVPRLIRLVRGFAPDANRAGANAYQDGVTRLLALISRRDEMWMRLRWTF